MAGRREGVYSPPNAKSPRGKPPKASTPMRELSATAIRFPPDLHERIRIAAAERGHSINFMTVLAVEQLLERLIPADEIKLTRD